MQTAIVLYPALTALDAVGPYDVLSRIPGNDVVFVARERGEYRTDQGSLGVIADATFDEVTAADILVVPRRLRHPTADEGRRAPRLGAGHSRDHHLDDIGVHRLVAARRGRLARGPRATTHWASYEELASTGAVPTARTSGRAGQDHHRGRCLVGHRHGTDAHRPCRRRRHGQAIQLSIEYDPQPPFDCGSPAKAGPEFVELLRAINNETQAAYT